jgi:hypothetical protein
LTTILPATLGPLVTAGAEALLDQPTHPTAGPELTAYAQSVAVLDAVLDHPEAGELLRLLTIDDDEPVPYALTCRARLLLAETPAAQRPVDGFRNSAGSNGAPEPTRPASGRSVA